MTPDMYCDPATGDIDVDVLGQVRLTRGLREEVSQRLATSLQFFLGEWFLDTRLGVPYYRDVLVRAPDMGAIKALLSDVVVADPGVEALIRMDLRLERETRVLMVDCEAVLRSGEALEIAAPAGATVDSARVLVRLSVPIVVGGEYILV